MSPVVVFIFYL